VPSAVPRRTKGGDKTRQVPDVLMNDISSSRPPASNGSPAAEERANQPSSRSSRAARQKFWRQVLRPLGLARNSEQLRDAIEELIQEDGSTEAIAPDERELLRNILMLHEVTVRDVMVPRADIVAVDAATTLPNLVKLLNKGNHSRVPVYRGSLDEIIGFVHIKDLLPFWGSRRVFKLEKVVREVIFAAPSMPILDLLTEMRDTRIHLALVIDEYGGVDGLVTIEDLVEEIVGEIEDEHDIQVTPQIVGERAGVAKADARVEIETFEKMYGPILTDEERGDVDTLGGLVFYMANRIPARGEVIQHSSGVAFEVLDADARRIRLLRLRNLPDRIAEETPAVK
jgi:CBS domain containing-hemolysin-like protein